MKESLKEYLKEMLERKDIDDKKGKEEEAGGVPVATSTTPTGQVSTEDLRKGNVAHEGSNLDDTLPKDTGSQEGNENKI